MTFEFTEANVPLLAAQGATFLAVETENPVYRYELIPLEWTENPDHDEGDSEPENAVRGFYRSVHHPGGTWGKSTFPASSYTFHKME